MNLPVLVLKLISVWGDIQGLSILELKKICHAVLDTASSQLLLIAYQH